MPRREFLALGDGAALWLTEAAAAGCARIRAKMAEAVDLAALHDPAAVDRALGQAATAGRFGHGDLAAILAHQAGDPDRQRPDRHARASTTAWPRAPAAGPARRARRRTTMAYIDTPSKTASIMLNTDGADDPDQLVGVAAGELFEWAWLIAELADWLDHADEHTRADFDRFFAGCRTPDKTAWFPAQIAERIAALLDGDRGQP